MTRDEVLPGAVAARSLLDGRLITLCPMAFGNLRLNIGDGDFIEAAFCYHDHALAWAAFEEWSGDGDPAPGWAKDPYDGRLGHCPCARCTHERTLPWNQARIAR